MRPKESLDKKPQQMESEAQTPFSLSLSLSLNILDFLSFFLFNHDFIQAMVKMTTSARLLYKRVIRAPQPE